MKKFDAIGLGYTCMDYLAVVPSLPELHTKLEMKEFLKQGGGPVATAMVALSRLGARVKFIGKVDELTGKRTILWTRGTVSNLSPLEVRKESVLSGGILLVDDLEVEAAPSAAASARVACTTRGEFGSVTGLAAMKCTMLGGRTALPSENEIMEFMKSRAH